jgi:predicted component of type VI protein secretion system
VVEKKDSELSVVLPLKVMVVADPDWLSTLKESNDVELRLE